MQSLFSSYSCFGGVERKFFERSPFIIVEYLEYIAIELPFLRNDFVLSSFNLELECRYFPQRSSNNIFKQNYQLN